MAAAPDFYELLHVTPNAPHEIIQAAYDRLAFNWHPDRNPGDSIAAERWTQINEAYATLSDLGKRQSYDIARSAESSLAGYRQKDDEEHRSVAGCVAAILFVAITVCVEYLSILGPLSWGPAAAVGYFTGIGFWAAFQNRSRTRARATGRWLAEAGGGLVLVVLLLLIVGWKSWSWLTTSTLESEPPIASVTIHRSEATIKLTAGAGLADVVGMGVFHGAKLDSNDEALSQLLGPKVNDEYWFNGSRLTFFSEQDLDGGARTTEKLEKQVVLYPPTLHRDRLFTQQLAKHLSGRSIRVVTIDAKDSADETLEVQLDGVRVEKVIWSRWIHCRVTMERPNQ
jgi:hypothetical protein